MPDPVSIQLPALLHEALVKRADAAGQPVAEFLEGMFGGNGHRVEVTTLEQLVALTAEPRERTFSIGGKPLKIRLRALNADESAEVDKIPAAITAPRDPRTGLVNEDDPDFLARLRAARRLSRAMAFDLAVLSFKLPGETLKERADALYKKLPPGVIDDIWRGILALTADPVENALFT